VNAVIALRQHFARSCLVPLLLSALFSGGVPPARAAGYENCNNCQNCVYNGQTWSCKDPPGLVKDGKSDRWWLGLWVLVILVGPALVLVVMKWMVALLQAHSRPIFPTYIVSNILGFWFGGYLRKRMRAQQSTPADVPNDGAPVKTVSSQERTRELRFVYHDGYIERVTIGPGPEVTLAVELDPFWNSDSIRSILPFELDPFWNYGRFGTQLKFSGILDFPSVRKYFEAIAQEIPDVGLLDRIGSICVDEKLASSPGNLYLHVNTAGIGSITFHCANVTESELSPLGVTGTVKRVIQIDGARFSSLEEFYDEVGERLIPGAYWGRNLDAFNDILRGGFGTPNEGFILVWNNHKLSQQRLGYDETVRQLRLRLGRCHPGNVPHVQAQLAAAERREGPTVFDWLVEIIQVHCPGGEEAEDNVELVLK
jgi:RNAse (barnase) inhibitor barstar